MSETIILLILPIHQVFDRIKCTIKNVWCTLFYHTLNEWLGPNHRSLPFPSVCRYHELFTVSTFINIDTRDKSCYFSKTTTHTNLHLSITLFIQLTDTTTKYNLYTRFIISTRSTLNLLSHMCYTFMSPWKQMLSM